MFKKSQLQGTLEALKKVKMAKIADKDFRNSLIKLHIFLLKEGKKFDADIEDLRTAHLSSYQDELNEVSAKQVALQNEKDEAKRKAIIDELNAKTELLEVVKGFNKAVADLGNEEVTFEPLSADKFAEEYSDDYDAELMAELMPIFE